MKELSLHSTTEIMHTQPKSQSHCQGWWEFCYAKETGEKMTVFDKENLMVKLIIMKLYIL